MVSKENTKEFYFKELLNYLTIKEDKVKYPGYIFYFKDDQCYFQYNKKTGNFHCNFNKVWLIFEKKYHMKHGDIQIFIKNMVEEHFKLKGLTPQHRLLLG